MSGEKLYVYSVDSNGDFKPGEVTNVWITKTATEFIKITLDNNREILTTPDHLYMLRDGTYKQANDLVVGQSLMPLYFNEYNHKICSIEHVCLEATPVYDISVKDYSNFLVDAGVILHNCADWKYRMAYWATVTDINSGQPENIPSDITNPNNTKGPGCKHTLLVLSNNTWLIKVSSVIHNYIEYMKKHYERLYADVIYPAIYQKEYTDDVQLDLSNDDTLITDKETISTSNEYATTKNQFKQGNEIGKDTRFKSSNSQLDKQISFDDLISD